MKQSNPIFIVAIALFVVFTLATYNAVGGTTDKFIVGGEPVTDIKDTPWQVALVDDGSRNQFCGGTLVDKKWVLTAAHCVDNWFINKNPNKVDVVVGTLLYATGGEQVDVKQIYVHPDWYEGNNNFDAALLELKTGATSGKPLQMAKPDSELPPVGVDVRVSGWGATSEGGPGADKLLFVNVPVVSNDICNKPESYDGIITPAMFCAGLFEGGRDACQGDSGGPVDTVDGSGNDRLVGIVSWGYGCARELNFGVYTRVTAISEWAAETIAGGVN